MSANVLKVQIDGRWIDGDLASDFGYLGNRVVCQLGDSSGRPRQLLLRFGTWQIRSGNGSSAVQLAYRGSASGPGLRRVFSTQYPATLPPHEIKTYQFFQQDVTGMVSLRTAVLQAVQAGDTQRIWRLFFKACQALEVHGKAAGFDGRVSLQCPHSLAVDARTV